jgi:rhomboid protease GluP
LWLSAADWGIWGDGRLRQWAVQNGGFWTGLLRNWRPNYALQPWTMFVTYSFLHAGIVHFAVNMMTLFSLGPPLVSHFGTLRFLLIYTLSTIGGAIGFALLSGEVLPMVGASGALFGLAGALMALTWRDIRANRGSIWPVLRSILWLIVLNLLLWWAMAGQLAWETHLGGFVIGWLVALLLDPRHLPAAAGTSENHMSADQPSGDQN